tara:strand:+ start:120 stop:875 length:756 start_codon:yes stop_codon:yes gene_type:complete
MKPIIAANWKMNFTPKEGLRLIDDIISQPISSDVDIIFFPSFVSLSLVSDKLLNSPYSIGGQNIFHKENGAFTGEISASMLKALDVQYVIIGHSERRQFFHENDTQINNKIHLALKAELIPIICIGESLQERKNEQTDLVLKEQLTSAFKNIGLDNQKNIIVAYEPVWAIGTGLTAEKNKILDAHNLIKETLKNIYNFNIPVLYGGSVNADNAASLINIENVDGFLVGGASLNSDSFCQIVKNVTKKIERF